MGHYWCQTVSNADVSCFTSTTILVSGARVLTLPDCTVCQDMYVGALREFKVQLLASIYYSRHPCMPLNTRTYFTFVRSDIKTNTNPKRDRNILISRYVHALMFFNVI